MSYIFGGDTGTTYQRLLNKRRQLQELQDMNNRSTNNPFQAISSGLGRLGTAIFQNINDKRIAEQQANQDQQLKEDFASLNTPALNGRMRVGMQGPPMPQYMVEDSRNNILNNISMNPALQRNKNANNIFQTMMRNKFASETPMTPYQKAQLKNQAMGYQLQAEKLGSDQEFRRDQLDAMQRNQEAMQDYRMGQLSLQRQNVENQQIMRDHNNQVSQDERQYKRQKNVFDMERGLSKDFASNPLVKEHGIVESAFGRIKAIQERGTSGAGDMSLVFSYMKMLDPTSVVREGEYANAQNTEGVPARILNIYNKVANGEFLTPEQRNEFVGLAQDFYNKSLSNVRAYADTYNNTIDNYGLNRDRIFKISNLYPTEEELQKSNEEYLKNPNNLLTGGSDVDLQRLDAGEAVNPIADTETQLKQIRKTEKKLEEMSDEELEAML